MNFFSEEVCYEYLVNTTAAINVSNSEWYHFVTMAFGISLLHCSLLQLLVILCKPVQNRMYIAVAKLVL